MPISILWICLRISCFLSYLVTLMQSRVTSSVWYFAKNCMKYLVGRYNRGWFYHRELRLWLIRVANMEPLVKTNTYERGSYLCFDPNTWDTVRKVHTDKHTFHPFLFVHVLYIDGFESILTLPSLILSFDCRIISLSIMRCWKRNLPYHNIDIYSQFTNVKF